MGAVGTCFQQLFRRTPAPEARSWPDRRGRGRVLLEDDDGASQWAIERVLARAGLDVEVCDGPRGFPHERCPLLADGSCELVAGADVVVNRLPLDHEPNRALLASLRSSAPETPVVVGGVTRLRARLREQELAGTRVLFEPADPQQLLAEVDAALGEPRDVAST